MAAAETKPDRGGRTPLHYAALENDLEKIDALLDAGADPNAADWQGFTPLHFAAQQWSVQAAKILLDRGAAVDPINTYGNTPLFTAVFNSKGRGALIELLRGRGADPLRVNEAGQTPSGLARLIGNSDVARYFADLP
jgi:ankyrin repeat protein